MVMLRIFLAQLPREHSRCYGSRVIYRRAALLFAAGHFERGPMLGWHDLAASISCTFPSTDCLVVSMGKL